MKAHPRAKFVLVAAALSFAIYEGWALFVKYSITNPRTELWARIVGTVVYSGASITQAVVITKMLFKRRIKKEVEE